MRREGRKMEQVTSMTGLLMIFSDSKDHQAFIVLLKSASEMFNARNLPNAGQKKAPERELLSFMSVVSRSGPVSSAA